MNRVQHVVIAIPARNEELLLPQCLGHIVAAQRHVWRTHPLVQVDVVVALDRCTDGSAAAVSRFPVTSLMVNHGKVGITRDAAIRHGVRRAQSQGVALSDIWIACTDADTLVPRDWLTEQIRLADRGADLVLGTVQPGDDLDPLLLQAWHARHQLTEGHPHIHGANLGVRATTWSAAGGFGARAVHEDVLLVTRARAAGATVIATDRTRVRTSARTTGRLAGGFSGYLRALTPASGVTA